MGTSQSGKILKQQNNQFLLNNQVFDLFIYLSIISLYLFQIPEYVIEYESRLFQSDVHVRFHTSNPNESAIKTYLWPALREGPNGPCVHKAVVIT